MTEKLQRLDAFIWLESLPDQSFDLWLVDPPYSSLDEHRNRGSTPRLVNWFPTIPNDSLPRLCRELYRTLKQDRHAYVFCDDKTSDTLKPSLMAAGFEVWRLVWNKVNMGMGYHYRSQYEFILFATKGSRRLKDLSVGNVLSHKLVRGEYPTAKPFSLVLTLVRQSTEIGEKIGDPFFGSGVCARAARECGCDFEGTDVSEEAHRCAAENLSQQNLFPPEVTRG